MEFLILAVVLIAIGVRDRDAPQPAPDRDRRRHRGLRSAPSGARAARRAREPRADGVAGLARDLAIDLGTANTLVYSRGQGIILNEPTVIALNSRSQDVLAMGHEAWQMIGRTPGYIVAVRPLRGGAITDFEITQRMIRLLFQRAGVSRLYRARVLDLRAVGDHPRRAARGARGRAPRGRRGDLPHRAADGRGDRRRASRSTSRSATWSSTSVVAPPRSRSSRSAASSRSRRCASARSTSTPRSRRTCAASTASRSASAPSEEIKLAIGSAFPTPDEYKAEVRGRDLMSGLPKTIILAPEEVRDAIEEQVRGDLRRGDRRARADAARARAGPHPARHPPRRRRRDAARPRPAHREGDRAARSTSSTRRSSASCSAPAAASSPSTGSKDMFMGRPRT